MEVDQEHWLQILRHNQGFSDPDQWVPYARSHSFRKVKAHKLWSCPDCEARDGRKLGQYVYYSTLITLKHCRRCGLAFADTHIDPEVIRHHFERAYKDEHYFMRRRAPIFDYVALLADSLAPERGRVLDIGGAQGHLLMALRRRRQDLDLTLNDLSRNACEYAERVQGLQTICCAIPKLVEVEGRFDVILLIDVLYYEPDIRGVWEAVRDLASESCAVVIRVPGRLGVISLLNQAASFLQSQRWARRQTSISWFNPEHVYVFSEAYLRQRLSGLGFDRVRFLPSPLLAQEGWSGLAAATYLRFAKAAHALTSGRSTITPCFLAIAQRGA